MLLHRLIFYFHPHQLQAWVPSRTGHPPHASSVISNYTSGRSLLGGGLSSWDSVWGRRRRHGWISLGVSARRVCRESSAYEASTRGTVE